MRWFYIPEKIKLLQQKGHEVILSTGRGPALFYGVDKQLNIDSYIASNGRYVVYKGEILYNKYIDNVKHIYVSCWCLIYKQSMTEKKQCNSFMHK